MNDNLRMKTEIKNYIPSNLRHDRCCPINILNPWIWHVGKVVTAELSFFSIKCHGQGHGNLFLFRYAACDAGCDFVLNRTSK